MFESVFFLGTRVAGIALVFVQSLWVTRTFGAEVWGGYSYALAIVSPLAFFMLAGSDTLAVKHIARADIGKEEKLVTATILSKVVLLASLPVLGVTFFVFPIIDPFEHIFREQDSTRIAFTSGLLAMLMAWFYFGLGVIRGFKDIVNYGLLQNVLPPTLLLLVAAGIFYLSQVERLDHLDLLQIHVVTFLLVLCCISFIAHRRFSELEDSQLRNKRSFVIKDAVVEGAPIMSVQLMGVVFTYASVVILGFFGATKDVAIYDIALKVSALSSLALLAINAYVGPRISELFSAGKTSELKKLIETCSMYCFWISLLLALVGIVLGPYILGFYGDEFLAGVVSLRLVLVAQFLSAMCGPVSLVLQMTNNQSLFQRIYGAALIVHLILNVLLIPQFGLNGAAVATLISLGVWNFFASLAVYKKLNIRTIHYPFKRLV